MHQIGSFEHPNFGSRPHIIGDLFWLSLLASRLGAVLFWCSAWLLHWREHRTNNSSSRVFRMPHRPPDRLSSSRRHLRLLIPSRDHLRNLLSRTRRPVPTSRHLVPTNQQLVPRNPRLRRHQCLPSKRCLGAVLRRIRAAPARIFTRSLPM